MKDDQDVRWLVAHLRRNPTTEHVGAALRELAERHGRDHVHRLLAIEYERADGSRWRHEIGDRGEGVAPERRPTWMVTDPGEPPEIVGPMVWQNGRGLVG